MPRTIHDGYVRWRWYLHHLSLLRALPVSGSDGQRQACNGSGSKRLDPLGG